MALFTVVAKRIEASQVARGFRSEAPTVKPRHWEIGFKSMAALHRQIAAGLARLLRIARIIVAMSRGKAFSCLNIRQSGF